MTTGVPIGSVEEGFNCAFNSMTEHTQNNDLADEEISVVDRSGRRKFIRKGAFFIGVGATALAATRSATVYADDCDRGVTGNKEGVPGSDADAGAEADPAGCGRTPDKPKISQAAPLESMPATAVAKVKA